MSSLIPDLPLLPENWTRALAVVAHPDDLEYGASSVVARWVKDGKSVAYVIATRGEAGVDGMEPGDAAPIRMAEERASAAAVGVDVVEFLDHRDGEVEYGLALRHDVAEAIRRHRPEVIVSLNPHLSSGGSGVNMADHRAVGLAVLDAVRDAGNRWVFRDRAAGHAQPWSGVRMVCFAASPSPTHAVDVSASLERGIAALREQRVYLENLDPSFDPEAYLREQAERVGRRAGVPLAVDFEVYTL